MEFDLHGKFITLPGNDFAGKKIGDIGFAGQTDGFSARGAGVKQEK